VNEETKNEQLKFRISASLKNRILEAKEKAGFQEIPLMHFIVHLITLGLDEKEQEIRRKEKAMEYEDQKGDGETKDRAT
jgi:hypothetical protein